nr:hypothetical protein [Tanacetum cinerariifolium]
MYCLVVTDDYSRVAERRNRILIEAARTMLADSKLPITFWAEALSTACYVQNRVFVVKPYNTTLYELFHGKPPTLSFMRPFGCLVTILNTIDHLGKFNGNVNEGFFVGYSLNSKAFRVFNSRTRIAEENLHISKAFRVFNSRTRIVEENLHIRFSESTPNVVCRKASDSADPKSSHDDGSKPSSDDGKKVDKDQEKEDNGNNTNNVNTVSSSVNAAGTNEVNVVGGKISIELPFDPKMPTLEDDSIIDFSSHDEDDGAVADMNNLDTTIQVSPIPTIRIHKDHPLDQVIGDLQSATQTRKMSKNLKEHEFVSTIQQRTNHKDLQNCLFACFLSQEELKKVFRNKKDEMRIVIRNKARLVTQGYTQEEGIDYDEVFAHVARIEAIRLFLAYASFKDFVVYQMNVKSAFLYGMIEEGVYVCQQPGFEDPDFPDRVYKEKDGIFISQDKYVAEILKKLGFTEVKTASTPTETQNPLLKDEDGKEVDVHIYRSMIGSLMYLTSLRPDIMFGVCVYARYQVHPKVSHLHAVKRIFRYLKGQPKLGLWYPKDSPFDLVAYTDSYYARASLDRKSTT